MNSDNGFNLLVECGNHFFIIQENFLNYQEEIFKE